MCIFHESTHNRKGTSEASEAASHCDSTIRVFLLRNFIHLFGWIEVCGCFASHSEPNATGTILINGKSTEPPAPQCHKSLRHDTRFSNKALHNSVLSYPAMSVDAKRCRNVISPYVLPYRNRCCIFENPFENERDPLGRRLYRRNVSPLSSHVYDRPSCCRFRRLPLTECLTRKYLKKRRRCTRGKHRQSPYDDTKTGFFSDKRNGSDSSKRAVQQDTRIMSRIKPQTCPYVSFSFVLFFLRRIRSFIVVIKYQRKNRGELIFYFNPPRADHGESHQILI